MPLAITVRFLLNRFDASDGHDRTPPEWPPAPARLFMALVAASEARDRMAHEALSWVATQGPPTIYADGALVGKADRRWLVTNKTEEDGGSARHAGRKSVGRPRLSRYLRSPVVTYEWPHADPKTSHAEVLQQAADCVGYLGRPTSPVIVEVTGGPAPNDDRPAYVPAVPDQPGDISLRVPYQGFLDDLCAAYPGRVEPAFRHGYVRPTHEEGPPQELFPSPWASLISLPFQAHTFVPGERVLEVTSAAREQIAPKDDPNVPVSLSGTDPGTPHCALLPLLHVGANYADGHLLGIALAIPLLTEAHRAELWRYLRMRLDPGRSGRLSIRLSDVAGHSQICFAEEAQGRAPWGARAERWSGNAKAWRTVLPAVLDRAPSRHISEEEAILLSIRNAGFPDPEQVWAARGPFRRGDVKLRPRQTVVSAEDRLRPYRHLLITWPHEVQGPVIIGALRHFGLGLCIPNLDEESMAS